MSWAQITLNPSWICPYRLSIDQSSMPLGALPNHLLMFCNLLGFPVEEEVLEVQDKSYGISYSWPSRCLYIVR